MHAALMTAAHPFIFEHNTPEMRERLVDVLTPLVRAHARHSDCGIKVETAGDDPTKLDVTFHLLPYAPAY